MNTTQNTATDSRTRGAIAALLDPEVLLEQAQAVRPETRLSTFYAGQMLFAVDHGEPAVVNSDGVGYTLDENDCIPVVFVSGMSFVTVDLSLDVLNKALTGETVDLADGIRRGAPRLDHNHYEWVTRYDSDHRP